MVRDATDELVCDQAEGREASPQSPLIKKGIIKRKTIHDANPEARASPMRRVSIKVDNSYSGIAVVQEAPDAQNEESAGGTGSSGSEHQDVQQDSTGSEQG
jgi:hypothetical protein